MSRPQLFCYSRSRGELLIIAAGFVDRAMKQKIKWFVPNLQSGSGEGLRPVSKVSS
jgi:hypothetical protein